MQYRLELAALGAMVVILTIAAVVILLGYG